jgi:predicted Rossmann fold flavoprotein
LKTDIAVIGGGAAGLMAALFAARAGKRTLLIERTSDGGRKILISGGGRCNVLPSRFDPSQYFTDSSPNILRNILRSWPDRAQRSFFEDDLGFVLELEEETGKLFPVTHRARDVRDRLVAAVIEAGAEIMFDATVKSVEPSWTVRLGDGRAVEAASVIVATGGLSVPKTGSDGIGLRIARELGHTVRETYAALTPLTSTPAVFGSLAGVSFPVTLIAAQPSRKPLRTHGGFLFTHSGYSGPSVLDVSHVAVRALERGMAQPIFVQWTRQTEAEWDARLRTGNAMVGNVLRGEVPERLLDRLMSDAGVLPTQKIPQLPREKRLALVRALAAFELPYNGHEGYKKAEVTGGGVALEEIDARTMQSRLHPGLFFCGEVLDAFGPIGGYNFAWAWATGRLAGNGAAAEAPSDASVRE